MELQGRFCTAMKPVVALGYVALRLLTFTVLTGLLRQGRQALCINSYLQG